MDLATVGLVVVAGGALASLDAFTNRANRASSAATRLEGIGGRLSGTFAALGLAFGVQALAEYTDTWTLLEARVNLVTDSHVQAAGAMGELFRIAKETRSDLESTGQMYTRLARSAEQLGLTQREVLQFTEALGNAQLVAGSTGVEAAQSMRQLSQALSAGKVQGDEFRTMMEAMPIVAKAVQDELGVTQGELYKMSRAGQVSAAVVVDAMLKLREEFAAQAKEIPLTIGQAITNLRTDMTRFMGNADAAFGITRTLTGGIARLGESLSMLTALIVAGVTAWVTYHGAILAINAAMFLYNTGIRAAIANSAIMTGLQTVQAFFQLARTVRSVADAMALLSMVSKGVAGVLATIAALTLGYVAYSKLQDEIAKQTAEWEKGLGSLDQQIGQAAAAVDDLNAAERRRLKVIADIRAQNAALIREAQQALELAGLQGMAEQELRIQFEAQNRVAERRADLAEKVIQRTLTQADMNMLMAESISAINHARDLELQTLQRREQLEARTRGDDALRELQQEIELTRVFGVEQVRLAAAFETTNRIIEAQRTKTGGALQIEIDNIALEHDLRITRDILQRFSVDVYNSLTGMFERIFSGTIESWEDLLGSMKGMFVRLLAEMASQEVMRRWGTQLAAALATVFGGVSAAAAQGVPEVAAAGAQQVFRNAAGEEVAVQIAGVSNAASMTLQEAFAKAAPYLAAAIAAYSVGSMAGRFIGGRGGSPAAGAIGGAAAGAATGAAIGTFLLPGVGTAVGATIGALVGFVGGLRAAKKAAEEYAEMLNNRRIMRIGLSAEEVRLGRRNDEAERLGLMAQQAQELAEAQKSEIFTRSDLIRLTRIHIAQQRELADQQAVANRRAYEDLDTRYLAATGTDREIAARRLQIEQQREYEDAVRAGRDATYLARLSQVHYAEAAKAAAEAMEQEMSKLTTDIPKAVPWELFRQEFAMRGRVGHGGPTDTNPSITDRPIVDNSTTIQTGDIINEAGDTPEDLARKMASGARILKNRGVTLRLPVIVEN